MEDSLIEHSGYVKEVTSNSISVQIISESACSGCHARGACGTLDTQEKIIAVHKENNQYPNIKKGQQVKIISTTKTGFWALFLGYILPFIIVLATLTLSILITQNEGLSGLLSLGALIPYYISLYLLRNHLLKTFSFSLREL